VWAVGDAGTILRRQAGKWTGITTKPTKNDLYGVWGSSATDVWAVGDYGAAARFDGKAWAAVSIKLSTDLRAVWGTGASDVWAAGAGGEVFRFDGKAWAKAAAPVKQDLLGLRGSAGKMHAVGKRGAVAVHDGKAWKAASSLVTDKRLYGLWGSGPTDEAGTVLRFNGASWSKMMSNSTAYLFRVWGSSSGNVFVVGSKGVATTSASVPAALHFNGSTWAALPLPKGI